MIENNLQISEEFRKFGLQFIQDIEIMGETWEDVIQNVLSPFTGEAASNLRAFLIQITSDEVSDAELQRLWDSTPADIYFHEAADLRTMLKQARDHL